MRLIALGCVLLLGCVPIPHHERETPEIHGILTRAGRPLAGVKVLLASGGRPSPTCEEPAATVVTDANGRFELPATRSFHLFIIFGDRTYGWRLCFEREGDVRAVSRGGGGLWIPAALNVSCELDGGWPEARCTSSDATKAAGAESAREAHAGR